jgi:hypothetical protein
MCVAAALSGSLRLENLLKPSLPDGRALDIVHHEGKKMPINRIRAAAFAVITLALLMVACNNGTNTDAAYTAAINDHFKAFPVCLWSQPIKFPVQVSASDDSKTQGYDALVQQGLLTRTAAEKKIIIISKQVNLYDLSDKGRSAWTPDTSQPGYGNFCYGTREVTSIDNSTPGTNGQGAKTVAVNYRYKLANVPTWANAPEVKTAFPNLATTLNSNPSDSATLVQTGDRWEYSK